METKQQQEIYARLIKNGWQDRTMNIDKLKGKKSLFKGDYLLKFDYINTLLLDRSGTILIWSTKLNEEQLQKIYEI